MLKPVEKAVRIVSLIEAILASVIGIFFLILSVRSTFAFGDVVAEMSTQPGVDQANATTLAQLVLALFYTLGITSLLSLPLLILAYVKYGDIDFENKALRILIFIGLLLFFSKATGVLSIIITRRNS